MIATVLLALATAAGFVSTPSIEASVPTNRHCPATLPLLIGVWVQRSPPDPSDPIFPKGDSRELEFVVEDGHRIYREYLHSRPGGFGRWSLSSCRLTVFGQRWRESYDIVQLTSSSLWLRSVGQTEIERFDRFEN